MLHIAVEWQAISIVKFLLSLKATESNWQIDLDAQDNNNETALQYAIEAGNVEIIKNLINAGAAFSQRMPNGRNIFHWMAIKIKDSLFVQDDLKLLVKQIQDANINIDEKDQDGNTPVMLAFMHKHARVAYAFMDASQANVFLTNKLGQNVLHLVVLNIRIKKVKIFITCLVNRFNHEHVDTNVVDQNGNTPFMLAINTKSEVAVDTFIKIRAIPQMPIHWLAMHINDKSAFKDLDLINKFIKSKQVNQATLALDEKNQAGQTPLMVAIENGNQAAAEALIEAEARLDVLDTKGYGLLHIAAAYVQDKAFLQFLIGKFKEKNLSIDTADQNGDVPLMIAVVNGNQIAVEVLLEAEANLQDILNSYFH